MEKMIHKNLVPLCIIDCCKMDPTQLASFSNVLKYMLDHAFDFEDDDIFAYLFESLLTCMHVSVNIGLIFKKEDSYDYETLVYTMFTKIDEVFDTIDTDGEDGSKLFTGIKLCMADLLDAYIEEISEANDLSIEMNVD